MRHVFLLAMPACRPVSGRHVHAQVQTTRAGTHTYGGAVARAAALAAGPWGSPLRPRPV